MLNVCRTIMFAGHETTAKTVEFLSPDVLYSNVVLTEFFS